MCLRSKLAGKCLRTVENGALDCGGDQGTACKLFLFQPLTPSLIDLFLCQVNIKSVLVLCSIPSDSEMSVSLTSTLLCQTTLSLDM